MPPMDSWTDTAHSEQKRVSYLLLNARTEMTGMVIAREACYADD